MKLAILIPNDYRQQPVLVELAFDRLASATFTPGELSAIRSVNENGGEVVKLRTRRR